jgi:hypothetical protein
MGLDMYAYAVKKSQNLRDTDQNLSHCERTPDELYYWRKHHDLHGWMENLYRKKGGKEDSFNCVSVRIEQSDLLDLQLAILHQDMPKTTGFFFGDNPPDAESNAYDLEFIAKALTEIKKGNAVYYTSWW